jgi:hypothetical protein
MPYNAHEIAFLSVYITKKRKSLTCKVTTQNIQNILKLVEANLMLEKKEAEVLNEKAAEASPSEANSK